MSAEQLNSAVAVVSGASSGIGWATARALSAHGARVVVLARRADRLAELVRAITADGGDAQAYEVDVADAAGVGEAVQAIGAEHGGSTCWSTMRVSLPTGRPTGIAWSTSISGESSMSLMRPCPTW